MGIGIKERLRSPPAIVHKSFKSNNLVTQEKEHPDFAGETVEPRLTRSESTAFSGALHSTTDIEIL